MTEELSENIIHPSKTEKMLLLEANRAQKAIELYVTTLNKRIERLNRKLSTLASERDTVVATGNQAYNRVITTLLKNYALKTAKIDFDSVDGPVIIPVELENQAPTEKEDQAAP